MAGIFDLSGDRTARRGDHDTDVPSRRLATAPARWAPSITVATGWWLLSAAAATGQALPAPLPADSLQANPQGGATPSVATPRPYPSPRSMPPARSEPLSAGPGLSALPIVERSLPTGPSAPAAPALPDERPQRPSAAAPLLLPAPSGDPLRIDVAADPILQLARQAVPRDQFAAEIGAAVARNPGLGETLAQAEEAVGARNEARAGRYPTADLSLTHFRVVSRAFSDDPLNILERSRPRFRTDGTASIRQPIFAWGSSHQHIAAASARLDAAIAGIDDTSTQLALRAVGAWYDVFGYRALVALAQSFVTSEGDVRDKLQERVRQGYSAPGDVAQIDSTLAATRAQLADYRRSLANAEAQYAQLVGAPAPARLSRAPEPPIHVASADRAMFEAQSLPTVAAARSLAVAARHDVSAQKAEALPALGAAVDAGRYGVIETARDYDVRVSGTLSWRIGGGAKQRIEQAQARAHGAEARYDRTKEEAQRDASIAWSDVQALTAAESAIADDYLATRRSRDVLAERFRVARGTLFDLLNADNNYFGVATRYIQTLTELDTARYVLLARTGKLLETLSIQPARPKS